MARLVALQACYLDSVLRLPGAVFHYDKPISPDVAAPCDEQGRRIDPAGLRAQRDALDRQLANAELAAKLTPPAPPAPPAPAESPEDGIFDFGGEEPEDTPKPKPKPKK